MNGSKKVAGAAERLFPGCEFLGEKLALPFRHILLEGILDSCNQRRASWPRAADVTAIKRATIRNPIAIVQSIRLEATILLQYPKLTV